MTRLFDLVAIPLGAIMAVAGWMAGHTGLIYFSLGWLTMTVLVYGVLIWLTFTE